jgi:hypothetical protein
VTYNTLDYLLVLILVLGTFGSLARGPTRALIGILSLYVGLVFSLLLYQPLAGWLRQLSPSMSVPTAEALAFIGLLMVSTGILDVATRFLETPAWERRLTRRGTGRQGIVRSRMRRLLVRLPTLLLALVVGFVVTAIWISLGLAILQYLVKTGAPAAGTLAGSLSQQISTSALVPAFNYALYRVYQSVSFWLPADNTPPTLFLKIFQLG